MHKKGKSTIFFAFFVNFFWRKKTKRQMDQEELELQDILFGSNDFLHPKDHATELESANVSDHFFILSDEMEL